MSKHLIQKYCVICVIKIYRNRKLKKNGRTDFKTVNNNNVLVFLKQDNICMYNIIHLYACF